MHGEDNGGKGGYGLWLKAYQGDGLAGNKAVPSGFIMVTIVVRKGVNGSLASEVERQKWEKEHLSRKRRSQEALGLVVSRLAEQLGVTIAKLEQSLW